MSHLHETRLIDEKFANAMGEYVTDERCSSPMNLHTQDVFFFSVSRSQKTHVHMSKGEKVEA
jgi:hypothetical protein